MKLRNWTLIVWMLAGTTAAAWGGVGALNMSYLGFGPPFSPSSPFMMGRWPNGELTVAYNPEGAPPTYRHISDFESVLKSAIREWESECGVRIKYRGADPRLDVRNRDDGIVAIYWQPSLGAALGTAGPSVGSRLTPSKSSPGYHQFTDGSLQLSAGVFAGGIGSRAEKEWLDRRLKTVLLHEFAHIFGIGHSDHPSSIMFAGANIWIPGLRNDDIEACRALYGPWRKRDKPKPAKSEKLHKFEMIAQSGLAVRRQGEYRPVGELSSQEPSPVFLFTEIDGPAEAEIRVVAMDSYGQIIAEPIAENIDCRPGYTCRWWLPVGEPDLFRASPGRATVLAYVNGRATLKHQLNVQPGWQINQPPSATLQARSSRRKAPLDLELEVHLEDPEGDRMSVVWHVPGHEPVVEQDIRGPTRVSRTFRIDTPGRHEVFVQVWDDSPRYEDAGDGYRILLRHMLEAK